MFFPNDPDKDGATSVCALQAKPEPPFMMPAAQHEDLPLVDPEVLHDLKDQLDDPTAAHEFVHDFVLIWPERFRRLAAAINNRDQGASIDSVLSLKITSLMLGAARLAQLAVDLEQSLRQVDAEITAETVSAIKTCGQQTVEELQKDYM